VSRSTPQERLVKLSLQSKPGQTLNELKQSIGAQAPAYLQRTLQVLTLSGTVVCEPSTDNQEARYFLAPSATTIEEK
jgi:hypothetical protein